MTYDEFIQATEDQSAGERLRPELKSLWYDKRGDWDTAHTIAQGIPSTEGSAIHAYLHHKEGDLGNANYWYNRAGRTMPKASLDEEWDALAKEMVKLP